MIVLDKRKITGKEFMHELAEHIYYQASNSQNGRPADFTNTIVQLNQNDVPQQLKDSKITLAIANVSFNGASIKGAYIPNLMFVNCDMTNADFSDTTFKKCIFRNNNIKSISSVDCNSFRHTSFYDCAIEACLLSGVSFEQSLFDNSIISSCHIDNVNFTKTTLLNTHIDDCHIKDSFLSEIICKKDVSFNKVIIDTVHMYYSKFIGARFTASDIKNSRILNSNFNDAYLAGISFHDCDILNTNFETAQKLSPMALPELRQESITIPINSKYIIRIPYSLNALTGRICSEELLGQGNTASYIETKQYIQSGVFSDKCINNLTKSFNINKLTNIQRMVLKHQISSSLKDELAHIEHTMKSYKKMIHSQNEYKNIR